MKHLFLRSINKLSRQHRRNTSHTIPFCITVFGAKSELFYHAETVSLYHHSYLLRHTKNCSTIHSQWETIGSIFFGFEEGRCNAVGGTVRTGWRATVCHAMPLLAPQGRLRFHRQVFFCLYIMLTIWVKKGETGLYKS